MLGPTPTRMLRQPADGPPVYTYEPVPGVPSVSVLRFVGSDEWPEVPARGHAHSHDFLVLVYMERAGGSLCLGDRERQVQAGDLYLIAPGEVIGVGADHHGFVHAEGWGVFFPPDVLGADTPGAFLSWRAHPLLFPFVGGAAGGAQRLSVPPAQRPVWSQRVAALAAELDGRRDGYHEAVLAHLTLLLVDVSRLAADVVDGLRLRDEDLLAEVFACIEARFAAALSLRDVADAVSLTPGHLTTVVRRKTGRTVGEWITERRMVEARRLLVQTDLSVQEVGQRAGYRDPAYFVRSFRRAHGTTPLRWRRAAGLREPAAAGQRLG